MHVDGNLKSIGQTGGPPQHLIDRCFHRMVIWCKMAEEICAAEFPNYELMQSLRPLDLDPIKENGIRTAMGDTTCFERLAQAPVVA